MSPSPGTSQSAELVNFNGLRVEKSSIPSLIQFLVQSDPMTVPSGEELEPKKREIVSGLFRRCFQDGDTEPAFLAALGGDGDSLRYLTGLMASRY